MPDTIPLIENVILLSLRGVQMRFPLSRVAFKTQSFTLVETKYW